MNYFAKMVRPGASTCNINFKHKSPNALLDRLNQRIAFNSHTAIVKPDCPYFKSLHGNEYISPATGSSASRKLVNKIENRYRYIAFSSDLFMDGTDHFTENSFCLVKDILFINFTRSVGLSPPVSIIDWILLASQT